MYSDFRDQNGNPVSAETVLTAIKKPIIKTSVEFEVHYSTAFTPRFFVEEKDIIRGSLVVSNSCASDGIKLGSVNIGMLKVTIKNEKMEYVQAPSELIDCHFHPQYELEIDDNTTVTVNGGEYWIKEVEQLAEGVKLTCYDGMSKLDEPFTLGTITGTPYQILTQATTACGVPLKSTQAEIEALPNGTRTFTLHSDNDCKTWRDVLSYLSMLMGCFVTFARYTYGVLALPGLVIRPFGNGKESFCDTVTDVHRYKGAKFSIFDTEYKAIELTAYAVDGEDTIKKDFTYAETTGVTGQTIKLGYNPFIQADTPEADLTQTQRDILHELLTQVDKYAYTPMQISLPVGFIYDLGDVLKCTGRLANTGFAGGPVDDAYGVILNETYTYGRDYRIKSLDSHAGKGRKIVSPGQKLSDLPVRALVKDMNTTYGGDPIVWRVLEHGHTGDPENSTTLESNCIITLKAFDAKEPSNSIEKRQNRGNARYKYSNLLQWLNSNAGAYDWYSAKHSTDAAPSSTSRVSVNPYLGEAGFLTNFSEEFRNALLPVTKTVELNPYYDGGGTENVESLIFILEEDELGRGSGKTYAFYNGASYSQAKQVIANTAALGNYTGASVGQAWQRWCRNPNLGGVNDPYSGCGVRKLDEYLTGANIHAYLGLCGVAPALCIPSDTLVSSDPDTDGVYILFTA